MVHSAKYELLFCSAEFGRYATEQNIPAQKRIYMESIIIALAIAVVGGLLRFAIKDYLIFKKFRLPSRSFLYGGFYVLIFIVWNISARNIYNKAIVYIPPSSLVKFNESVSVMVADNFSLYYYPGCWLLIWFTLFSIDMIASFVNKEKKAQNQE